MQVYLVGGAVRDRLLGLPIKDKDFVVVGASREEMVAQGFVQVGMDFPVFLHPISHHEYALARLERKSGTGHTAFSVHSDKQVSLKEDLYRRDLTINALAMPVAGLFDDTIIGGVVDYYGGLEDLRHKVLRHIGAAFVEDPLRVLRVARFYARLFGLGFKVHHDTQLLMQSIAKSGEMADLSHERLWAESAQAMSEADGFAYWQLLFDLDILAAILPALHNAWQNKTVRCNVLTSLKQVHQKQVHKTQRQALPIAYALLMASFEHQSDMTLMANRLRVPKDIVNLAMLFYEFKQLFVNELTAKQVMRLIERTKFHQQISHDFDDNKMPTIYQLIEVIYCYMQAWHLPAYYTKDELLVLVNQSVMAYRCVSISEIDDKLNGRQIGQALQQKREQKIANLLKGS